MKNKFIICLSAALCLASFFTACGGGNSSESTAERENSLSESGNLLVVPSIEMPKKKSGAENKTDATLPTAITYIRDSKAVKLTPSIKYFMLEETSIRLHTDYGWKIVSGGNATDNQTDCITSYPAVIQYSDTKNTITIIADDECEDKDSFLAGTEESYIETYGSEFERIDISDFEQLSISGHDSFKIVANVVIGGEKYEMTHIISNDVSKKTLSWMMLDNDGSLKDFDLVGALLYPIKIDRDKFHTRGSLNFDSGEMYRWDNEKKEAVRIN